MDLHKEIDIYLRARYTLLSLISFEEERIIEDLRELCEDSGRSLFVWDVADNFQTVVAGDAELPSARDPLSALEAIEAAEGKILFVLPDFHQCWDKQPRVIRKLRNLVRKLKYTHKSIIVITPSGNLPDELRDDAVCLEVPPPDAKSLTGILKELLQAPKVRNSLKRDELLRLVRAALGLSSNHAQRIFAKALVTNGRLDSRDLEMINSEKKQIIRRSGALEFYSTTETIKDVGGLDAIKQWLAMRSKAFSNSAQLYGLPAPKGIALIGIPGTGKSLTAKVVAGMWQMPLIRLDVGALFGGLVGESEKNTREALQLAETVAPCLLWIDEIEKGLSTGDGDGGTSLRVMGSILSWMQDKKKPVFVIATANNIERLPPELLRRGRFDEIFFLDLPTSRERREIIKVHIKKRSRKVEDFDIEKLVLVSEGYVGSEIEQAVIDALYIAFCDESNPGREVTTEDVVLAFEKLIPMSKSQQEPIEHLRRWVLEGRAQSASLKEEVRIREVGEMQLDIDTSLFDDETEA